LFLGKSGRNIPSARSATYSRKYTTIRAHRFLKTAIYRDGHARACSWLNATLTVEAHQAGSHQGKGWETFTDHVIATLSAKREHLVFILWGSYAKSKASLIDQSKHLVLTSVHPSPLSAHHGFFGNHHFSTANAYLQAHGIEPINW